MLLEGATRQMPVDVVLLLALLPAIASCRVDETDYQRGYRAGYSEGFASGYAEASAKSGVVAKPPPATRPGPLTSFNLPAFLAALIAAAAFGVALQYSILSDARRKQVLPSLAACAFVPGMRSAFAFRLLEEKTRAMAELAEFLRQVREESRARIAEIETVREEVEARIRAASSLEALFAERTVELAKREFEKIVEGR
jgi:hypothetical protein